MVRFDPRILDEIAELEVQAIKAGLEDPELRRNPAFLEKVRKFMKDNNLVTQPETPGVKDIQKTTVTIPDFDIGRSIIN